MTNIGAITWQDAEDALLEAVELLGRMPDRARGFLSSGSRSCWPEVLREADKCEHSPERAARPGLTRQEVALVDRWLVGDQAIIKRALFDLAQTVPVERSPGAMALVGVVLIAKLDVRGVGWDWKHIAKGARRWRARYNTVIAEEQLGVKPLNVDVGSDAIRQQYERAVGLVSRLMDKERRAGAGGLGVARAA